MKSGYSAIGRKALPAAMDNTVKPRARYMLIMTTKAATIVGVLVSLSSVVLPNQMMRLMTVRKGTLLTFMTSIPSIMD